MSSFKRDREHIRQLSIVAYVVMLALLLPMTLFLAQQEQNVQSRAAAKRLSPTPISVTPTIQLNQ